ncbi:LOW QUALITY PROTEIN: hypothetical protein IFM46972_07351 [Aspergillus udagawae]|uniref:Uncharacterized protein n=1 Tax=Aspergillus udagawae TaxID=91492 RepID=A0A8H3P901_9EURO|nr:LOW QUALITY PROTEIN: hypothetical protein IFM46972_07351 [Aspergillus udagawae]
MSLNSRDMEYLEDRVYDVQMADITGGDGWSGPSGSGWPRWNGNECPNRPSKDRGGWDAGLEQRRSCSTA